jgi:hypothetical protein
VGSGGHGQDVVLGEGHVLGRVRVGGVRDCERMVLGQGRRVGRVRVGGVSDGQDVVLGQRW